eukprot:Anaeramoba_flamelloidesa595708_18.p1 GENE.a595708_18~~a595708_18.p1  ORF type:complete len:141 (-),score=32.31 a595708_18:266-688(-)
MFGSKKEEPIEMKKTPAIDKADIKAFLGAGSRFEGKLSFSEMVRLDGVFSGEIESSDSLVVGETAEIEGTIRVGALVLSGTFKGDIKATGVVDLRAPAKVSGRIETPSLKVEDKVIFNGEIVMPGSSLAEDKTEKKEKRN